MKAAKRLFRRCLPGRMIEYGRNIRREGDFRGRTEARDASLGYDSDRIFARGAKATRAVRTDRVCFERDGVAFHNTVGEAIEAGASADVLLISGVLAYVEKPWDTLDRLLGAASCGLCFLHA